MHTKDMLAEALFAAFLPELAARAANGEFHDYLSDHPTPTLMLLDELAQVATIPALELRQRVIDGEFDATEEEAEEWAASDDGQAQLRQLLGLRLLDP